MEGPSLFLAANQLKPFNKKVILAVEGNTKIGKERLLNQKILKIFSWGKHLVFQFEEFAFRIHFMLFGSFEATVKDKKVTGDYPKKNRSPRLKLFLSNGHIEFYSCSIKYIESSAAINQYDNTINIMSEAWDPKQALKSIRKAAQSEIGDLLLDQEIFAGVGNIIKNEVLFLVKVLPSCRVEELSVAKLGEIVKITQAFSWQFYEWRKQFVLRTHYRIYRQSYCPVCKNKVTKQRTGLRERMSYFCTHCQK